jgi:acetyltransferase
MTIRNLDKAFDPKSVAIVGASRRDGSVGKVVLNNVIAGGFAGEIWPVNPKYSNLAGIKCYADVAKLPAPPDVAVIMTPPATVPGIVSSLGAMGCRAGVVLSAGLTAANGLRQQMLDAAKPHLFRIFGPNVVGLILPNSHLNASFAHLSAEPGGLALLSQSGALVTTVVDWAAGKRIGFSALVSLGDMADVDAGDCLDMLANDRATKAILMYLETIPSPRKFLSAARAASRMKPVIAIKSGRHDQSARAAATHTGALAGMDAAVDAALSRAGILRVNDLDDLFDAAEITARFQPLEKTRLAIVTNGGGAGVLAVDRIGDLNLPLAEFNAGTLERLDRALPATWSRGNPADIIGDAPAERYREAVLAAADDPGTDVLLVMNCPTGLADPITTASEIAAIAPNGAIAGKPVLACWLGNKVAEPARAILRGAGVACFETPDEAVEALDYVSRWSRAQAALARVPEARSEDVTGKRGVARDVMARAAAEGRRLLTEPEAKEVISAYGIPVPETLIAPDIDAAETAARKLLASNSVVVVKVLSRDITHKSDIGGVILNIATPAQARAAAFGIAERFASACRNGKLDGFAVQPMVKRRHAREILIGVARDPVFGPVILFGAGGIAVEVVADTAMALPPLDDVLGRDLVARTRIGRLLAGYRDVPAANLPALLQALNGISQLVVDFPAIAGIDVNPLLCNEDGAVAIDARIEIDPARAAETGPNRELPIRPYPGDWERVVAASTGEQYRVRPIKPADIALYPDFLSATSPTDLRMRFHTPLSHFPEPMLKRLTQIDYEREMAFIALEKTTGAMAGVARLATDPDRVTGEFGILVRTDLKGRGLGASLLSLLVEYGRGERLETIQGFVLSENTAMLKLAREQGFVPSTLPGEPGVVLVSLKLSSAA